jgi:sulfur-oxidizing protein SoxY
MTDSHRRSLVLAWAGVAAAWLLRPLAALAQPWNRAAFEAMEVREAMRAAGVRDPVETDQIVIKAPELAENGAQVPVEIESLVPGTQTVSIFADRNVQPYVGTFVFRDGTLPFISTRIKMGETSLLRVVVQAGERQYVAMREVKVTIGGCGS